MSDTTTVATSGDVSIDALTHSLKWSTQTITWSLPTAGDQYGAYDFEAEVKGKDEPVPFNESNGLVSPSAKLIAAARAAMAAVEEFTNLDLVELTESQGDAEIRIAMTSTRKPGAAGAYAILPLDDADPIDARDGDVWLPNTWNPVIGNYDWIIVAHELNHSLGLTDVNRAKDGVVTLPMAPEFQSTEFAIQSYKAYNAASDTGWTHVSGHSPQSQMMYDIAALQFLSGANYTTNAGDTTYSFSATTGEMSIDGAGQGASYKNIIFRTLWDGGGIDTYDFSDYGADRQLDVDLSPGGWSDVDRDSTFQASNLNKNFADGQGPEVYARGQVFNALLFEGNEGSLIENVTGGDGDDIIRGNQAQNRLLGGAGNDTLFGGAGIDTLDQGAGGGAMYGGDDQDRLIAGDGAETLDGGANTDRADYSRSTAGVAVNLATGTGTGGYAQGDVLVDMEQVIGSDHADTLTGGAAFDVLRGGAGNDLLIGAGDDDILSGIEGNDTFLGGAGADYQFGGAGFDVARFQGNGVVVDLTTLVHGGEATGDTFVLIEQFEGTNGNDQLTGDLAAQFLIGRGGADRLRGMGGDDYLRGDGGIDTLDGGAGIDIADYAFTSAGVQVNLEAGIAIGGNADADELIAVENIAGSAYDDDIVGDANQNVLRGNSGNDRLDGNGQADFLFGGAGQDTLVGGFVDLLDGGTGYDTLRLDGGPATIDLQTNIHAGSALNATIQGVERIEGSAFNDSITAGNKTLDMFGLAGDDTLTGGKARDSLFGGDGQDRLVSAGGDDFLTGGAGNDWLEPGAGVDLIFYGLGDGHDSMLGYSATDDFIVLDRASFGADADDTLEEWLSFGGGAPDADHGWLLMDGDSLKWDVDGSGPAAGATTLISFFRGDVPLGYDDFLWA